MGEKRKQRADTMRTRTSAGSKSKSSKKKKGSGGYILLWLFLTVFVLCIVTVLSFTVFFKIDTIVISGVSPYSENEVTAACGLKKGMNLLLVSSDDIERNVTTNLPYIKSVKVRRSLPSKITLTLEEATPHYALADEYGTYAILDSELKVLETGRRGRPGSAVEVSGLIISNYAGHTAEFKSDTAFSIFSLLTDSLNEHQIQKVTAINMTDISSITVTIDDRIRLDIGSQASLKYKLDCAVKALEQRCDETTCGTLNLSLLTTDGGNKMYFREGDIYAVSSSGTVSQEVIKVDDKATPDVSFVSSSSALSSAVSSSRGSSSQVISSQ